MVKGKRSPEGFKSLDEFLDEEGIREEVTEKALDTVALYERTVRRFPETMDKLAK